MISKQLTLVLIGLALCSCVAAQNEDYGLGQTGLVPEAQLVRVVVDEFNPVTQRIVKAEVVAPLFDPAVTEVPAGRVLFDLGVMDDMYKLIMKICQDTMIKQKWAAQMVHYALDIKRVLSGLGTKLKELPEEFRGPPMKREYVDSIHDLWHIIMGESTKAEKMARPEDEKRKNTLEERKEFVRQLEDLFFVLNKFIAASPVGIYVNWTQMTINGEVLGKIGNSKVRFFKRNGYATTMNVFNLAVRAAKPIMMAVLGFKSS